MSYRESPRFIAAGIVATSTMTLFSHLASRAARDNFNEPLLLDHLLRGTLLPRKSGIAQPAGWATHYAIGCALAAVFYHSWKYMRAKPTLSHALLYGWCGGLTAVMWWHTAFRLHPAPPRNGRTAFYLHLLAAHLVFSISVARVCSAPMPLFTKHKSL